MCVKLFTECKIKPSVCKTPHFVENYTICVNIMKNYILFVEQHILCNIKGVSFTYPFEIFTLDWIFYTTSGCDGCDKYQVCPPPLPADIRCEAAPELLSFTLYHTRRQVQLLTQTGKGADEFWSNTSWDKAFLFFQIPCWQMLKKVRKLRKVN